MAVPEGGSRQYPAVMLATGDHDDRVVPLHSYKLIAQMQHMLTAAPESAQRNPLLLRVEVGQGVGVGGRWSTVRTLDTMVLDAEAIMD